MISTYTAGTGFSEDETMMNHTHLFAK
jgi:hypothetical protein